MGPVRWTKSTLWQSKEALSMAWRWTQQASSVKSWHWRTVREEHHVYQGGIKLSQRVVELQQAAVARFFV